MRPNFLGRRDFRQISTTMIDSITHLGKLPTALLKLKKSWVITRDSKNLYWKWPIDHFFSPLFCHFSTTFLFYYLLLSFCDAFSNFLCHQVFYSNTQLSLIEIVWFLVQKTDKHFLQFTNSTKFSIYKNGEIFKTFAISCNIL